MSTRRARSRRREQRQEQIERAARICWVCWTYERCAGMTVCVGCFTQGEGNARRMCAGKRRLAAETAADRAAAISLSEGVDVRPYECPVCQWWHVGGTGGLAPPARKQRSLAAAMWVANVDQERLRAAIVEYGNDEGRLQWERAW